MMGLSDNDAWLLGFHFGTDVFRAEYFRLLKTEDYWSGGKYASDQDVAPLQHMKDYLYDYWMEHPEEFIALKARCRLGVGK